MIPMASGLSSEQIYDMVPRYSSRNLKGDVASTLGGTQRITVDPYGTADQSSDGFWIRALPSTISSENSLPVRVLSPTSVNIYLLEDQPI